MIKNPDYTVKLNKMVKNSATCFTINEFLKKYEDFIGDTDIKFETNPDIGRHSCGKSKDDGNGNCWIEIYSTGINEFLGLLNNAKYNDLPGTEQLYEGIIYNIFSQYNIEKILQYIVEFIICHEFFHICQRKKLGKNMRTICDDGALLSRCEVICDVVAKTYLTNRYPSIGLIISNLIILYHQSSSGSEVFCENIKKYCLPNAVQNDMDENSISSLLTDCERRRVEISLQQLLPASSIDSLFEAFLEWDKKRF